MAPISPFTNSKNVKEQYAVSLLSLVACDCNTTGTKPGTVCDATNGQCDCQPFVNSRQCDQCIDNYHDLQITGCKGNVCQELVSFILVKLRVQRSI